MSQKKMAASAMRADSTLCPTLFISDDILFKILGQKTVPSQRTPKGKHELLNKSPLQNLKEVVLTILQVDFMREGSSISRRQLSLEQDTVSKKA